MNENFIHVLSEGQLAPYAIKSLNSKGRKYNEEHHPFRTPFQRDTARIIHSRPFRRLEYKTQVFLNGTGDHYRTRLTHTMEVSTTARTIARALMLNEDLTEAIALAHDLGHTPFGHIGENALNKLLKPFGKNFEHNMHSLRIVDELILKYPEFPGLNLTWETRTGLLKHRKKNHLLDNKNLPENLSLEAQAADIADDLTYYVHDIDDGLNSELITLRDLSKLEIWKILRRRIKKDGVTESSDRFVQYAERTLIDFMVTDVLNFSSRLIKENNIISPEIAQNISGKLISFSPLLQEMSDALKDFLYSNLYKNKIINEINSKTENIINCLFELYCTKPEYMGKSANEDLKNKKYDLHTVVTDYIAGMTDRFATIEYNKYFT